MTRVPQLAGALLVTLLLASDALAGGFQLNEHGARAMAQGGAFTARATDLSAMYFNPAGLSFQKTPSIYLGTTAIAPTNSFYGPAQENTNHETKMVSQLFFPINVYGAYPITDDLIVGVGVNNPYGLGTEWPENWAGKNLSVKIDLQAFFIGPTVAYRLLENLSVGIGASYATGTVKLQRSSPFDSRVAMDLTADGFGFNGGILYKPLPELSVGLCYRSKVKMDASGTATFTPNIVVLPTGDVSTSITLPATGYLGVAYQVSEALSVEADYQYIGWSSYDKLTFTFAKDGSSSSAEKNYEDTYILRFGGEYTLGDVKLRAGYYYDHTPVSDPYVDPMLPDANRHGISAGVGFNLSKTISVDVAYLFIKFVDRTVTNTNPATSFDGTYKSYANLFALNLGFAL